MLNLRKQHMKYWMAEMPIGDPHGGVAFGEKKDPIFSLPLAAQVFIGATAAQVITSGLNTYSSSNNMPPTPALTPPTAMPSPGDATTKAAERASIAEQLRRRGRASTILTDQSGAASDKLGA